MLRQLHIENYAVIEAVAVEFGAGLNLLTGETGAGKSILIGALGLLLGERASAEIIRPGTERALVSGEFDASAAALEVLREHGIACDRDSLVIILRREVLAAGKARVFINDQPATVALLKQIAPALAAIHAQNESLLAFDAAERLRLLDHFAALETEPLALAYARYCERRNRIAELEQGEQDRLRLVDLWSFQKTEIEQAKLEAREDWRLEAEKLALANAEKLRAASSAAAEALYDSDASAAVNLRAAEKQLQELCRYDQKFREALTALESARITVEDLAASLGDYAARVHAEPERLAEIEDRLALIERLKRKYGTSIEEIVAFAQGVSRKLAEVEDRDEILAALNRELKEAGAKYLQLARAASKKRAEAAGKLERLVETEINSLAMKARFQIEINSVEDPARWSATGFDQVAYLIATNPGQPPAPLERIASGGELSRVMLALKATIESAPAPAPKQNGNRARASFATLPRTLVFDEIDAGIGGRAAEAVGKKLKALSLSQQVLCVTHLPQIACFADHHYVIGKAERKTAQGWRAQTTVQRLRDADRRQELARMISGATVTETSLRHAEQMLKVNP